MKATTHSILFAMLIWVLFSSCEKTVRFNGVVLSRHGIPMPNQVVAVSLGHGEHNTGAGGVDMTTDENGSFNYTGKICSNCWASEISVYNLDSGSCSGSIKAEGQAAMKLILK